MAAVMAVLVLILAAGGESASAVSVDPQPSGQSSAAPPAQSAESLAPFDKRLGALIPSRPREYFELAEEIAEINGDVEARTLARELCVLAFELWRNSDARRGDPRLGPSALLMLASFSDNNDQARWIRALAAAVDPESLITPDQSHAGSAGAVRDAAVLDLVSALELLRAGEGRRATKLLDKPGVWDLLVRYERLLSPGGMTGGADRVRRLAIQWPICLECHNRRYSKGPQGVTICATCGGDPGPPLSPSETLYQVRLEAALLEGVQRSWVAQTLVDGGRPLRDLDSEEIVLAFRVDPKRTLWRDGAWTEPASTAPAAPAKEQGDAPTSPTPVAPAPSPPPETISIKRGGA
jgi:hypothetical protein